jgi:hypothetical protein
LTDASLLDGSGTLRVVLADHDFQIRDEPGSASPTPTSDPG